MQLRMLQMGWTIVLIMNFHQVSDTVKLQLRLDRHNQENLLILTQSSEFYLLKTSMAARRCW